MGNEKLAPSMFVNAISPFSSLTQNSEMIVSNSPKPPSSAGSSPPPSRRTPTSGRSAGPYSDDYAGQARDAAHYSMSTRHRSTRIRAPVGDLGAGRKPRQPGRGLLATALKNVRLLSATAGSPYRHATSLWSLHRPRSGPSPAVKRGIRHHPTRFQVPRVRRPGAVQLASRPW